MMNWVNSVQTLAVAADAASAGLGWQAWATGALVLIMLAALATGRFGTDIVMMGVVGVLLLLRIIKPDEAFKGFANTGVATVALLYVVATGLQETGGMSLLTTRLFGRPKSALAAQSRMIVPVAGMSAFLNNTPIVAMFMPVLSELSRRSRISASYLFMPLSFAAILGGVCTLIGTSTNLVVFSLIEGYNKDHKEAPLPEMGMWTLSWVGVPIALIGVAYVLVLGRTLLKDRSTHGAAQSSAREYMTAMKVPDGSPLIGQSVEGAGLRHLPGLFLSRIDRLNQSVPAAGPEEKIQSLDVLVFVGNLDSVVDLQKIKGLLPVTGGSDGPVSYRPDLRLTEAVIAPSSDLVGRTIRDSEVRTRHGAAVIAVHRMGHRLEGRIGDIVLRAGDTLLLEVQSGFAKRHRDSKDFYLVSELEGAAAPRHERAWVSVVILVGLVAVMSTGKIPFIGDVPEVVAALCAALAMILFRCCTGPQARLGIEWPVLIVIGASFGVGKAMENSGLAPYLATHLTDWAGQYGPWALIGVTYLITLFFTTLISNNAAAALMFPIAVGISQSAGVSFMPFAVAICLAASLEFMTPLGYQTNLMVMGPGGYRWGDFLRFGGPLTIIVGAASVALIPIVFPLN